MNLSFFFVLAIYANIACGSKPKKVYVTYPIELLQPVMGSSFEGRVSRDTLTCFGNRDYDVPTFKETIGCMLNLPGFACISIWGSRSVIIEVEGSVEFLKVNRLPRESTGTGTYSSLNVTRWLNVVSFNRYAKQREVKQISVEPIYLCARSNDWRKNATAIVNVQFRPMYIRERDRVQYQTKAFLHMGSLLAVSSIWLLPYLAAAVMAAAMYSHGMNYYLLYLCISCCVVLLTPLMLTKKYRHTTRAYFSQLFTRVQAEETKLVIKERLPVLQAFFLSCVVVCVGSAVSYIVYAYCGIDREIRTYLLKATLSLAAAWVFFFLCRSFDRFCGQWVWLVAVVGFVQALDRHINPLAREEIFFWSVVLSYAVKAGFSRLTRAARLQRILTLSLPRVRLLIKAFGNRARRLVVMGGRGGAIKESTSIPTMESAHLHSSSGDVREWERDLTQPFSGDTFPTTNGDSGSGVFEEDDGEEEEGEEGDDVEDVVDELFEKEKIGTGSTTGSASGRPRSLNETPSMPKIGSALWQLLEQHTSTSMQREISTPGASCISMREDIHVSERGTSDFLSYNNVDGGDNVQPVARPTSVAALLASPEARNRKALSVSLGKNLSSLGLWDSTSSAGSGLGSHAPSLLSRASNLHNHDTFHDGCDRYDYGNPPDGEGNEDEMRTGTSTSTGAIQDSRNRVIADDADDENNNVDTKIDRDRMCKSHHEAQLVGQQTLGRDSTVKLFDHMNLSENSPFPYPNLIGAIAMPVSTFPLVIDNKRVWIPLAEWDHDLLNLVHTGLTLLGPVNSFELNRFDRGSFGDSRGVSLDYARRMEVCAIIRVASYLEIQNIQKWIAVPNNNSLLNGIFQGAHSLLDDVVVSTVVIGSCLLKIQVGYSVSLDVNIDTVTSAARHGVEELVLALLEQFADAMLEVRHIGVSRAVSRSCCVAVEGVVTSQALTSMYGNEHAVNSTRVMTAHALTLASRESSSQPERMTGFGSTGYYSDTVEDTPIDRVIFRSVSALLRALGMEPHIVRKALKFDVSLRANEGYERPEAMGYSPNIAIGVPGDQCDIDRRSTDLNLSITMDAISLSRPHGMHPSHTACYDMLFPDDIVDNDAYEIGSESDSDSRLLTPMKVIASLIMATYVAFVVNFSNSSFVCAIHPSTRENAKASCSGSQGDEDDDEDLDDDDDRL